MNDIPLTLGVEEEFFLVDPDSRDIPSTPDTRIFDYCERNAGQINVTREAISSQIEIGTPICYSIAEARKSLGEARRLVIEAAQKYGSEILAASTHPFARWQTQEITPKKRYQEFVQVYQDTLRRFMIGGMHIHAGFADKDIRIRVMTAMRRHLPLFHALSTSSPFADGRSTGFKSWRLTLMGGLPRTGIPPELKGHEEYEKIITEYRKRGFINNSSELWWDIRPSYSYPTIEMRICDVCTRIDDAIGITALYACLLRYYTRLDRENALPPEPMTEIIAGDRWIAQRYGVFSFFSGWDGNRIDVQDHLVDVIERVADDAKALDCEAELHHTCEIIREGTSADHQLDLYRLRETEGDNHDETLRRVVDQLLINTRKGIS